MARNWQIDGRRSNWPERRQATARQEVDRETQLGQSRRDRSRNSVQSADTVQARDSPENTHRTFMEVHTVMGWETAPPVDPSGSRPFNKG